jgi:membrane-bound metal-dependent hydrolase YbcI (DUF457 family)
VDVYACRLTVIILNLSCHSPHSTSAPAQHYMPLHRFFHTYIGASIIWIATFALFMFARRLANPMRIPNWLQWRDLKLMPVAIGTAAGSYSHIVLDSIMHGDIKPLAPLSDTNVLLGIISTDALHWECAITGLAAIVWLDSRQAQQN